MLKGKRILLGVCSGIAAYKAAFLTRLLVKAGAEVQVVMTPGAKEFITPLTLSTLSKNPVFSEFASGKNGEWTNHVQLALNADLILIAPATANTLAKMASGFCDNLLLAVYLSARCPVMFAPAMDLDMLKHPATQKNIESLKLFGNILIPSARGELASGLHGEGRLAEPEQILKFVEDFFGRKKNLSGKKVLISAGPTYEAIDPVRFIGNHSSGKMGVALAEEAAKEGAQVTLVLGPSSVLPANSAIKILHIESAQEMYNTCNRLFKTHDIAIMSAAVADYRPAKISATKIKKQDASLTIQLEPTPDTLASLGKLKTKKQTLIGFALETNNEIENAKKKVKTKNLDFIVLNSLRNKNAGFRHNTNKISIIDRNNKIHNFELKNKDEVAKDIIAHLIKKLKNA
ncbi:MAG: Coenzyme A biosynthesis bifunctional protein CoaBC [Bacteroidia bacterium]|nr:Coenzyme A biosynthesis bifunctional protein CoaBC [Bacteroidia bacterium]